MPEVHALRHRPIRQRAAGQTACGCAMGARFLAVALVLSLLWYGWQWVHASLPIATVALRVLAISFGATAVGKLLGMALFWRQHHAR